jgi:hypothetical protein
MTTIEMAKQFFISKAHPECKTYAEALKAELTEGCFVLMEGHPYKIGDSYCDMTYSHVFLDQVYFSCEETLNNFSIDEIIGHPITLNRVLNALDKKCYQEILNKCYQEILNVWMFLKEDGSDCLFDDQTPETQSLIANSLGHFSEIKTSQGIACWTSDFNPPK